MIPAWLLDIVAAFMLVVAAVSAARLVAARPGRAGLATVDTDVAHLLMAIAMAGMLATSLSTLSSTAWEVIFGLMTAWFAVRVLADVRASGARALAGGHCAPHLVHSAAMLYMFLALSTSSAGMAGMAGMSGSSGSMTVLRVPTLAFLFALVLVGYSIWDLDQLSGSRYRAGTCRVTLAGVGAAGVPAMAAAESGAARPCSPTAAQQEPDSEQPVADRADSREGGHGAANLLLSPAVTVGCRIIMGIAMAFMLIIFI
jgi:Domain of unknown function (DUF5134)